MLNARICLSTVLALWWMTGTSRAQERADGYIDTNFTATCFGSTSPRALAVQFDGKIIAGEISSRPLSLA